MRRRLTLRSAVPTLLGCALGAALVGAGALPAAPLAGPPMTAAASTGWSPWQALGGPLSGAPDATSWGPGHLDFFGRGTDGHLHHRGYPTSAGGWSAYDDLGAIASDPTAASPRSGQVEVFATFADRQVHYSTWHPGVGWGAWQTIPGVIAGSPDAASARDGYVNLVARDRSNRVILNVADPSGRWTGWRLVGGAVTSDPTAVSRHSGPVDIFARGPAHDLVQVYSSGGSWHTKSLGGILSTGPDAAAWSAGHVDVFAVAAVNRLYQLTWDASTGWASWHTVPGLVTAQPGAVSWGPGRLDLFVRSTGNLMYHSGASQSVSTGGGRPDIVAYAARYLGVGESPPGSNCTKFEPARTCLPWCTYFATWVWHQINPALPYLSFSGSVYDWAVGNGRWKAAPSQPAPGDIAVYGSSSSSTVHTGIVESVSGGRITTIDGNYSDRVSRVGPFDPATITSPARILGYASPVPLTSGAQSATDAMTDHGTTRGWMSPAPTLDQIRSQDGGH